ncbi:MAG TPA: response regulator transcription factor [Saprospiraceae bacterium]|nr:response regulator transcription factor [Saprospiraceae bacterium]
MRNLSRPIKVLIADAHPLFRLGIRTMLQQMLQPKACIVGEVNDGESLVAETARLLPDVVLLEVQLPRLQGPDATRQILRLLPHTRILALSSASDPQSIHDMMHAGAAGYLVKTIQAEEITAALKEILSGNTYYSRDAYAASLAPPEPSDNHRQEPPAFTRPNGSPVLTKREWEILHFVAEEKSNQEIARLLFLSPRTVETHKRNMLLKLKMKNVAGLVKFYLQSGRRDALAS